MRRLGVSLGSQIGSTFAHLVREPREVHVLVLPVDKDLALKKLRILIDNGLVLSAGLTKHTQNSAK